MPLIGVSMYRQTTAWWSWERDAALVPGTYLDVVRDAGGQPLLIPPASDHGREPSTTTAPLGHLAGVLDGLMLIGGGDIDASRYDRPPDPRSRGTNPGRDESEFGLLAEALRLDLPVLAVCRGLQVLNVGLGGKLVQHLPDVIGSCVHQPGPGAFGPVTVVAEEGTTVHRLLGDRFEVLCSHHQAVDSLGRNLVVTARSEDGVIEAVELPDRRFVLGVQWHPEESGDLRLFEELVLAGAQRRASGPTVGQAAP